MFQITAKYRILSVTRSHNGRGIVNLGPTYAKNGQQFPENASFWKWTPSGAAEFIEGYQEIIYEPGELVYVHLIREEELADLPDPSTFTGGDVWYVDRCSPSPSSGQLDVRWCRTGSRVGTFEMCVQNPTVVRHLLASYTEKFLRRVDEESSVPSRWIMRVCPAPDC